MPKRMAVHQAEAAQRESTAGQAGAYQHLAAGFDVAAVGDDSPNPKFPLVEGV